MSQIQFTNRLIEKLRMATRVLKVFFVLNAFFSFAVVVKTQTTDAPNAIVCERPGRFPLVDETCQAYYFCFWDGVQFQSMELMCPDASRFNSTIEMCTTSDDGPCIYATSTEDSTSETSPTELTTTTNPTTAPPTTTSPPITATTTEKPFACDTVGKFPMKDATCQGYYYCVWNGSGFRMFELKCPNLTRFNPAIGMCVLPATYNCTV